MPTYSPGVALKRSHGNLWLYTLLLFVLFFPSVKIWGEVPLRPDDLMVFCSGGVLVLGYILRLRLPKLDAISLWLVINAGTILLSTIVAQLTMSAPIGAKEYLDLLRPVKYLIVYLVVRDMDFLDGYRIFKRVIAGSMVCLLAMAVLEMIAARTSLGGSTLIDFFSLFTAIDPNQVVQMLSVRPFATFNTPTDLGYVAVIGIFIALLSDERKKLYVNVCVSFFVLLLTATRTFMFSLPLMMMLYATAASRNLQEKIRRLFLVLGLSILAVVAGIILMPVLSPNAAKFTDSMVTSVATGNTSDQDSITTRMNNLALVGITLKTAPILGVATRSYMPSFVDSELIVTFHRYGIVGFVSWLVFFPLAFFAIRKLKNGERRFLGFLATFIFITFLYGITQGALDNSRIGSLLFIALGLGVRRVKDLSQESGLKLISAE